MVPHNFQSQFNWTNFLQSLVCLSFVVQIEQILLTIDKYQQYSIAIAQK